MLLIRIYANFYDPYLPPHHSQHFSGHSPSNNFKAFFQAFSDVYEKLCRNFSISKQLCKRILNKLHLHGFIEYVNSHGIKLTPYTRDMLVYLDTMDRSIN